MKILFSLLILSVLLYATFEIGFDHEMGLLIGNEPLCFILTYAIELITICSIPVMLKWLGKSVYSHCILGVLVLANTIMYCLTLTPTFGYLILICLLVIPFIYGKEKKTDDEQK